MARRTGILREFFLFLWETGAYWMIPIILVLLLLTLLVYFGGSAVAPFIYTLF
ncbi:MAG: DUF5989 family protein [Planctomycetota bacterium]